MKKSVKITGIVIIAIIVLAGGVIAWLMTGKINPAKAKVLQYVPLPLAMTGNKVIFMKDFNARYELTKKFLAQNPDLKTDEQAAKKDVFDGMLEEQKMNALAGREGVSVSQKELDSEYSVVASQTDLQGKANFEEFLGTYGLTENAFKQVMLKPQILSAKLSVWFNKQRNLNEDAYKAVDTLQQKLNEGATMESLAKDYSEDASSKAMEGDMGFSNVTDLLPELREDVETMNVGQAKLIVSRYGLHFVRMEEKDNNGPENSARIHLRQIFIKPGDFSKWYKDETDKIRVRTFIDPVS